jgi:eukaryotic-like serine/threonine-protein kinase
MNVSTWDPARWQRVSDLFNQALDLDPAQRETFLQQLRADAPELAQAVARMLAADAAFATDTPPNASAALADAIDAELPAGTQLGAYAIDSCLGTGGMGRVYRAHRVEGDVTQTVAIKCLRFRTPDPEFTRRFLRERRILAQLTHPNIARFLDAGTDPNGQPFVVIEYIDGVSIVDFARTQRLPLRARVELLLKVMRAVAYSHRQLIVHRDLKPGNVLVTANGEPQLLDFGIAKQLTPHDGVVTADGETALEQRAFSLGHAAPEQLRGGAVGTACDIYALGVLAYELLCAQAPLALAGLPYVQAERLVLEVFPAPPSERLRNETTAPDGSNTTAWERALRGDLDNIVLHALKKEPNERYPTVDAFIDDLRRHLDREPISLRSGQRWYRVQRFVRRHRLAVGLATTLLLALSGGSVALWRQNLATAAQRDTAIAQSRRAEALNGLLLNAFEAADPSRNRGNEVTAREVLDQAARRVNDAGLDPATRVTLLTSVADVYRTLGLAQDSAAAAQTATAQVGDIPPLLHARARRALAQAKLALDDVEAAEAALGSVATLLADTDQRAAFVEATERELVAMQILIARGRAPETLDRYGALYARAKIELGAADALTIRCGMAYAAQLRIMNYPKESGILVEELLRSIPDAGHDPSGVQLLGDWARSERAQHRLDQAALRADQYADGVRLLYGERHYSYVKALDLLAKIEQDKGDLDRAIDLYRKALDVLARISITPDSPARALALNNLANALRIAGRLEQAQDAAQQSVRMAEATLTAMHVNTATFRTTLAEILIERGAFEAALAQLDQSDAAFAALQSANSPGLVRASGEILRGESLLGLGRRDEARAALDRGWIKLRDLGPGEPRYERAERLRLNLEGPLVQGPKQTSSSSTTRKE